MFKRILALLAAHACLTQAISLDVDAQASEKSELEEICESDETIIKHC